MVILNIEVYSSDFTVYLENPIKRPRFITLRKCLFRNLWINLPIAGTFSGTAPDGAPVTMNFPVGNYSLETIKTKLRFFIDMTMIIFDGDSLLKVRNKDINLSDSVAELFGLKTKNLKAGSDYTFKIKDLAYFFIHNDLVDSNNSLKQGYSSQILSTIVVDEGMVDITPSSPIHVDARSVEYVSSLRFSIKDNDGKSVDNGIYPMFMILEIN